MALNDSRDSCLDEGLEAARAIKKKAEACRLTDEDLKEMLNGMFLRGDMVMMRVEVWRMLWEEMERRVEFGEVCHYSP